VFSEIFQNLNKKNFGKCVQKFLYKSKNGKMRGRKEAWGQA
jgi:hypothetical protein